MQHTMVYGNAAFLRFSFWGVKRIWKELKGVKGR